MEYAIRSMGLGEILDQAIKLVMNKMGLLLGIACVMLIPLEVVQALAVHVIVPTAPGAGASQQEMQEFLAQFQSSLTMLIIVAGVFSLIIFIVAFPITQAAIMH